MTLLLSASDGSKGKIVDFYDPEVSWNPLMPEWVPPKPLTNPISGPVGRKGKIVYYFDPQVP